MRVEYRVSIVAWPGITGEAARAVLSTYLHNRSGDVGKTRELHASIHPPNNCCHLGSSFLFLVASPPILLGPPSVFIWHVEYTGFPLLRGRASQEGHVLGSTACGVRPQPQRRHGENKRGSTPPRFSSLSGQTFGIVFSFSCFWQFRAGFGKTHMFRTLKFGFGWLFCAGWTHRRPNWTLPGPLCGPRTSWS